ncbi:hypothetical protein ACHQM5_026126 [Ranunculus cassubicifolius]
MTNLFQSQANSTELPAENSTPTVVSTPDASPIKASDATAPSIQAKTTNPYSTVVDPYYIHPSESPNLVFSSTPLKGDNYGTWELEITKALNAKGKLGFINGSLPPPTDPTIFSCWKRANDLVSSWIINSVTPEIRSSCLYGKSALHVWNELKMRFAQSNAPKIFQLKASITCLKQENLDVTGYYSRLKSLWDELDSIVPSPPCICGASQHIIENSTGTDQWSSSKAFMKGLQIFVVMFY